MGLLALLVGFLLVVASNPRDLEDRVDPRHDLACDTESGPQHRDDMVGDWQRPTTVRQLTVHCRRRIPLPQARSIGAALPQLIADLQSLQETNPWRVALADPVRRQYPKMVAQLTDRLVTAQIPCAEPIDVEGKEEACRLQGGAVVYISMDQKGLQAEVCGHDRTYPL